MLSGSLGSHSPAPVLCTSQMKTEWFGQLFAAFRLVTNCSLNFTKDRNSGSLALSSRRGQQQP